MMTYLATFIPNFSEESQPLRDLLNKNVPFEMSEDHLHCFQNTLTQQNPPRWTKTVQRKAVAQQFCRTVNLLHSHPKRSSNNTNTDRKMLAVVFGINRCHTYLYGSPFRVITDHKPLEMIAKKPFLRAPPRFQRMLQKIQGYDFTIEYRQGKTMTLADTLSMLPNPKDQGAAELDLRVDGIEIFLIFF